MRMSNEKAAGTTRRVVLVGAGAVAAGVLAGCATYDQRGAANPAPGNGSDPGSGDSTGDPTPGPLAHTAEVPVGGGIVLDRQNIVITQPQAGNFKAFNATCTHQGCQVVEVRNGTINCPCHGSQFKIADGSVAQGPAARPLREIAITVSGADIDRT
jgi:Rieske Fe-S protein